jgi:hypothetical protein
MSLVGQFLSQIRAFVRSSNGDGLRSWLQVEPGAAKQYYDLGRELRAGSSNSKQQQQGNGAIDKLLESSLPLDEDDAEDGSSTAVWPGFVAFMKDYLVFWRDIDYEDLLAAHELLSGLAK